MWTHNTDDAIYGAYRNTCTIIIIDELGNNHLFGFIYKQYIKTLGLRGDETLLDFGSGSGAGSKHLAKILRSGGELICVDTSAYWTAKAKKRLRKYKNVTFHTDPLTELNLPTAYFDVIYVFYVLHDVSKPLRPGIVKEFFRILKPDGRLCLKEPQREDDGMPVCEIKELMSSSGFKTAFELEQKGTYQGVFQR
jgi:ubiquinone/menaquinone biosynthesis C-methylase UbiE